MAILFRKVKKEDNKILAELIRNVFIEFDVAKAGTVFTDPTTDALYELFQTTNSVLWIAEEESEILGCCGIFPTENLPEGYTELVKFYVKKSARGKKTGLELMKLSINSAKELKYKNIYLESLPEFNTALTMYQKEGFVVVEKRLGSTKHFGCDVLMVKNLE